jgi:BirA family biotin operon repressor/biotin-[acetyl-CoA-carboxylase] ligase
MRQRVDQLKDTLAGLVDNIVLLEVTESTHSMAKGLMTEMDHEQQSLGPSLIVADRQLAGQGRLDRTWESPEGGLYLNWLKSGVDAQTTARLPMLAAAAAIHALAEAGVARIRVKWPNDLIVDGAKIAGLLVFARHGETSWVTVGLGINLETAPEVAGSGARPAISVADVAGPGDPDGRRHQLCCSFVAELSRLLNDHEPGLERWREHLIHRPGDHVSVRLASGETVDGVLEAITEDGFLQLDVDGTERVISGGDIIES